MEVFTMGWHSTRKYIIQLDKPTFNHNRLTGDKAPKGHE